MRPKANGKRRDEQNNLVIDRSLYQSLMAMAEQTHRSMSDLVTDLLSQAIHNQYKIYVAEERWHELSRREQEIIALYCLGYTSEEIEKRFTLSTNTVKTHLRNGMQKLGLTSRSELKQALADWDFSTWLKIEPETLPGYLQAYLPLPGFSNGRKRKI
jgi:DNA-binding CsgD family transcriptional regulator